ncbi:restriction endonuclease subunit S [Stenotrophomonas sp. LGBM10]|uniref:restriction endonuclease subunit S n=1 Tax=Stenotrophomonas sp. LGBM10 TaxID=3390038 RepID=UPI00398B0767
MHIVTAPRLLGTLATVRQGHPFRGAIRAVADGDVQVIQLKDLAVDALRPDVPLLRTVLRARKAPDWVRDQDILIAGRGNHPLAMLLRDPPPATLCSPHLYVLRVEHPQQLLPAFLAWQLNQPPAQQYLRRQSAGSRQQSIRRSVLDQLPVQVPPVDQQQRILALARRVRVEQDCLEALVRNRQQQLAAVAERILAGPAA